GSARLGADGRYIGSTVERSRRLRDVAHAGQTLLSSMTASLIAEALPEGASLVDLGAHRLADLARAERIFELRGDGAPGVSAPLRSLDAVANNLPVQPTSFVGRTDELTAFAPLLAEERLVTLTGSGGCGKTRFALQAAAAHADRWTDGIWWVELGPIGDPA